MLDLNIVAKDEAYVLHLPTKANEISVEWLSTLSEEVNPAANYSLIALVSFDKINMLLNAAKKNENMQTSVIPMFIKSGATDSEFIKSLKPGEPIVTVGTVLSRAIHVRLANNVLAPNSIISLLKQDTDFLKTSFNYTTPIGLVEFKLLPNCDIYGTYSKQLTPIDQDYVIKVSLNDDGIKGANQ